MAKLFHAWEDLINARDSFHVFDDFNHMVTADVWTSVITDLGAATVGDAVGGRLSLAASDGTVADNDEIYIRTTAELFLVADNAPIMAVGRLQYTEANTDDANVFVGLMSAIAANALVDDGAGMRTTGNFFVFFKVDGGTTWQVRSRNGTETETNDTGVTAGGASYQRFQIDINNQGDGTSVKAEYFIDGVQCRDATTNLPISHSILVASSTEMHLGAGVKNGFTNLETLVIDYLGAGQKR